MTPRDTPDANPAAPACTVIVTVDADERVLPDMVAQARAGLVWMCLGMAASDFFNHMVEHGPRVG